MSRKSSSYQKGYEHTDFSGLLSELNSTGESEAVLDGTAALQLAESHDEDPKYQESEQRHRIMSDETVKYLYSPEQRIIHDKHCKIARSIPDSELMWSEEYLPQMTPCEECKLESYIMISARDPEETEQYLLFFKKVGMTEEQIRNLYVEHKMETRIASDGMTIWYKDDTWRIKTLPKKGHVQLYHNNYIRRANGVREFTQGFHIQGIACEDTDIGHALSIIKKYEYKSSEAMLHNYNASDAQKNKIKQKKMELQEDRALSLEEILGERSKVPSLWQRFISAVRRILGKKNFFDLNGFMSVAENGYPKNQTICIYIWKDRNGALAWQTGMYFQKQKHFSVRYGTKVFAISQEKVIAWKQMTADEVAIDISIDV